MAGFIALHVTSSRPKTELTWKRKNWRKKMKTYWNKLIGILWMLFWFILWDCLPVDFQLTPIRWHCIKGKGTNFLSVIFLLQLQYVVVTRYDLFPPSVECFFIPIEPCITSYTTQHYHSTTVSKTSCNIAIKTLLYKYIFLSYKRKYPNTRKTLLLLMTCNKLVT